MAIGIVAMALIAGLVLLAALNGFGQPRRKAAAGDGSASWVGGSGSDCDSGSSDGGCSDGGGGGGGD